LPTAAERENVCANPGAEETSRSEGSHRFPADQNSSLGDGIHGAVRLRGAMRAVIQRVRRARVSVEERVVGKIGAGALILLGVGKGDSNGAADYLAEKTANLRIFEDPFGKMNLSLMESGGAALVVSQFTLYGDVRRGRRPGFDRAAPPAEARGIYEHYVSQLRSFGIQVETGIFQARMAVELENDGPVTILADSEKLF
jgi:D-tyrosyl-tRNA(Tyr) deacylase